MHYDFGDTVSRVQKPQNTTDRYQMARALAFRLETTASDLAREIRVALPYIQRGQELPNESMIRARMSTLSNILRI